MAKTSAGTGCVIAFMTPFCLFGLAALGFGVQRLVIGKPKDGLPLLVCGLIFCGIGLGMILVTLSGARKARRKEAIKAQNPDKPWLWREDWAAGRIKSTAAVELRFIWLFTGIWNLLSWPAAVVAIHAEVIQKRNYKALFVLIFIAVGLGLLAWAIHQTLKRKKFGVSIFEMASAPGVIGGTLSGVIHARTKIVPEGGFHVKLRCVNRIVTGSGEDQSTHEHILWEDEATIARELLAADPTRSAVPVFFRIPYESKPSNSDNPGNQIVWRLEASAEIPGIDYSARFDVPVFKTAESSEHPPEIADPLARFRAPGKPLTAPISPGIRVNKTPGGGMEFYFGPARNPGCAIAVTTIFLILTGVAWAIFAFKGPLILAIFLCVFDAGLMAGVVWTWFGASRAVFERGTLTVRNQALGIGATHVVPFSDVDLLYPYVGSSSGDTVYYRIQARCKGDRLFDIGGGLKNKREVEWLIGEMNRAMGRQTQAAEQERETNG